MLLAGATLAALPEAHVRRSGGVNLALEYFNAWHRMCQLTRQNSCQEDHSYWCGDEGEYRCLPSWKFNNNLTAEEGTGSAPDGDEDAILGAFCG